MPNISRPHGPIDEVAEENWMDRVQAFTPEDFVKVRHKYASALACRPAQEFGEQLGIPHELKAYLDYRHSRNISYLHGIHGRCDQILIHCKRLSLEQSFAKRTLNRVTALLEKIDTLERSLDNTYHAFWMQIQDDRLPNARADIETTFNQIETAIRAIDGDVQRLDDSTTNEG